MKVLKKNNGFTKSKGFTLVELIVVIAIIGILAAVLIPSITGYISKARISTAEQEAKAIMGVYESYLAEVDAGTAQEGQFKNYYNSMTNKILIVLDEIEDFDNFNDELYNDDKVWVIYKGEEKIKDEDFSFVYISDNGYKVYFSADRKIVTTTRDFPE